VDESVPRAKAPVLCGLQNAKAEALAYLEAKAWLARAFARGDAVQWELARLFHR